MPLHLRRDRWGYDGDDGDGGRDDGRDDDQWLVLLSGIYTSHSSSARFLAEFQFPDRG